MEPMQKTSIISDLIKDMIFTGKKENLDLIDDSFFKNQTPDMEFFKRGEVFSYMSRMERHGISNEEVKTQLEQGEDKLDNSIFPKNTILDDIRADILDADLINRDCLEGMEDITDNQLLMFKKGAIMCYLSRMNRHGISTDEIKVHLSKLGSDITSSKMQELAL